MHRRKHYLDSRTPQAAFHAITVHPGFKLGEKDYVRRGRILEQINSGPERNSATIIMGPPGSGRTTLARQWASEMDEPTQVIYVRMPDDIDLDAYSPPSPYGNAIADVLNAVALPDDEVDEDKLKMLVTSAIELSVKYPARVVLDDLEILELGTLERMLPVFAEAMATYAGNRVLMIGRAFSTQIMSGIRNGGTTRVISNQMLAFDETEARMAHQLGLFGHASLNDVQQARVTNAGWFTGMLNSLDGKGSPVLSNDEFDGIVLNNFLQTQSTPLQYVLTLAAHVPLLSDSLWKFIVAESGLASRSGGMLLAQLPIVYTGNHFELASALSDSLRRLTNLVVESAAFNESIGQVLGWYVRNNDHSSAVQMARQYHLEAEYLQLVRPAVVEHARAEDWHLIAEIVEGLPIDILTTDPEIPFWYSYALTGSGQWSEMLHLHKKVTNNWSNSENDLLRGRDHQMKGWIARGDGDYETALVEFDRAYHTLPAIAHQERMYASASADASISHLGPEAGPNKWRSRTAFELSHLPPKQRWWHGNIGPLTLGFVASSGKMNEAYRLASQQVEDLEDIGVPDFAWRYLLLLAGIDTERHRFDSASAAIERARPHIVSAIQKNMLVVQESVLLAAKGDYEAAMGHLDIRPFSAGRSVNNEFRFKANLASQNLAVGNVSTADFLLNIAAWPRDPWPRNFGDPHPDLLRALILTDGEDIEQAILLTQDVIKESKIRENQFIQICGHATLAHIYNESGDHSSRDQEIESARSADKGEGFQHAFYVMGQDVRRLSSNYSSTNITSLASASAESAAATQGLSPLTPREIEVITFVSQGMANKDIATALFISLSTVKNHLANIYSKLGVTSRQLAVSRSRNLGILDD